MSLSFTKNMYHIFFIFLEDVILRKFLSHQENHTFKWRLIESNNSPYFSYIDIIDVQYQQKTLDPEAQSINLFH